MTKRSPFGSRDPNVWPTEDTSLSSIPSVEEALGRRRKKRKKKPVLSTSKTPRISNRSSKTSKQLRRLKQSMDNRAASKQNEKKKQDVLTPPLEHTTSTRAAATKQNDTTVGSKRKGSNQEDVAAAKKKLKGTPVETHPEEELPVQDVPAKNTSSETSATANEIQARTGSAMEIDETVVNVTTKSEASKKVPARNVAAEYLHAHHRDSPERKTDPPVADQTEPVVPVCSIEQANEDTNMMDCTSDDESLHLSPASAKSPEKVEEDKEWVLVPPAQVERNTPLVEETEETEGIQLVEETEETEGIQLAEETEETERSHEFIRRLSMMTHYDYNDSPRTPSGNVGSPKSPSAAREGAQKNHASGTDTRRGAKQGIVTKGMLARAREAEADDEAAIEAMLKSGPPHRGMAVDEEFSSPDMSIVGRVIDTEDQFDTCDGSEVTMLSPDSLLLGQKDKVATRDSKLEANRDHERSVEDMVVDKTPAEMEESPELQSDISEASAPLDKRILFPPTEGARDARQHDDDVQDYQVGHYIHDGVKSTVMIPHPELPSGWMIRISESKQLLVYSHPDYGTSWHCPVVISQHSKGQIQKFLNEFFGRDGSGSTDQETESEKTIMADEMSDSHSQASCLSGNTHSTSPTVAETVLDDENTGELVKMLSPPHFGDDQSRASAAEDESEKRGSPMEDEELVSTIQFRRNDKSEAVTSSDLSTTTVLSPSHSKMGTPDAIEESSGSTEVAITNAKEDTAGGVLSPVVAEVVSTVPPGSKGASSESSTSIAHSHATEQGATKPEIVNAKRSPSSIGEHTPTERDATAAEIDAADRSPPSEAEELVSTAQLSRNVSGVVALQETESENELVSTKGTFGKSDEPLVTESKLHPGASESDEDIPVGDLDVDVQEAPTTESAVDEKMESTNAELLSPIDSVGDKQGESGSHNEAADGKAKDEGFEVEVDNAVFTYDHEDLDLSPQAKRLSPSKDNASAADGQIEVVAEVVEDGDMDTEPISFVQDDDDLSPPLDPVAANARNGDEDVVYDEEHTVGHSKRKDFEGEVDDLVFENDHGDVDLSPQEKRVSPTKHYDAVDDPSANILSDEEIFDGTEASKPPKDHDNDPFAEALVEPSRHNVDHLSVTSSLTELTSSRVSKWERGFSHRALHPPCPLCSLTHIEELIKAALERMKRRRKSKSSRKSKSKRKSIRRRETATRLVFD